MRPYDFGVQYWAVIGRKQRFVTVLFAFAELLGQKSKSRKRTYEISAAQVVRSTLMWAQQSRREDNLLSGTVNLFLFSAR